MYRIGIDIGGTNIKAGVVDENYNIVESTFGPTKAGRPANEIVMDACTVAESAMNLCFVRKEDCAGVGISCAGTCAPKEGKVRWAFNLGFHDVPVCDLVSFKFGLPAKLANDADAAALGEMVAGAAKGKSSVLYMCVGTGIGVGLVLDGKIYSGFGYGGVEAGHMRIIAGGQRCTCGEDGCFEAYASATALVRQAKEAALKHPESDLNAFPEITGRTVFAAAGAGDAAAKAVVEQYYEYLAIGTTNLINIFDPEIVVIGGGVSKQGETLLAPVREYVADHIFGGRRRTPPEIVTAVLGDSAGVIGAAAMIE